MKGHVRKYKGRWAGIVELERDQVTGKRRQKWVYGDTRKEVEQKIIDLMNQINKNEYMDPSNLTVAEYMDRWMLQYCKSKLAPKTYSTYERMIRNHIQARLGTVKLDKLKPLQIQTFYTNMLTPKKEGGSGLSPASALYAHRIFHEALKHAVQWQIIRTNPVDSVQAPKQVKSKHKVWDSSLIARMIEHAKGTVLYLPILLSATTGMRRGEVCGLQWEDIDLKKGYIYIKQQLQRVESKLVLRPTKTDRSERLVMIAQPVICALKEQKKWQKENRIYFGSGYINNDFVCTWTDGRPVDPDYITKTFLELIKQYRLPPIRFHDLRHSHATELLRANIHPKIVSERLGHSSIKTTLDIYSQVLPDMQKEAAEISAKRIFDKKNS